MVVASVSVSELEEESKDTEGPEPEAVPSNLILSIANSSFAEFALAYSFRYSVDPVTLMVCSNSANVFVSASPSPVPSLFVSKFIPLLEPDVGAENWRPVKKLVPSVLY